MTKPTGVPQAAPSWRRRAAIAGLAWLAMVGIDFLLHAGVLARWYVQPHPFLLPPQRAFAMIPVGYAAFVLPAVLLVWLAPAMRVAGAAAGFRFGMTLGAITWGGLVLGLLSISTAPQGLLAGWFVGQALEMGIAGAVVGSALAGRRLGRLLVLVIGLVVAAVVVTVVLQSTGVAPALRAS